MLLYLYLNWSLVHSSFFHLQSIASTSPLVTQVMSMNPPETEKSADVYERKQTFLHLVLVYLECAGQVPSIKLKINHLLSLWVCIR